MLWITLAYAAMLLVQNGEQNLCASLEANQIWLIGVDALDCFSCDYYMDGVTHCFLSSDAKLVTCGGDVTHCVTMAISEDTGTDALEEFFMPRMPRGCWTGYPTGNENDKMWATTVTPSNATVCRHMRGDLNRICICKGSACNGQTWESVMRAPLVQRGADGTQN